MGGIVVVTGPLRLFVLAAWSGAAFAAGYAVARTRDQRETPPGLDASPQPSGSPQATAPGSVRFSLSAADVDALGEGDSHIGVRLDLVRRETGEHVGQVVTVHLASEDASAPGGVEVDVWGDGVAEDFTLRRLDQYGFEVPGRD